MKLRFLAMATVCAAALTTPAMAHEGWYLGLGGGYDGANSVSLTSVANPRFNPSTGSSDSGIGALSVGYGWESGWRRMAPRIRSGRISWSPCAASVSMKPLFRGSF